MFLVCLMDATLTLASASASACACCCSLSRRRMRAKVFLKSVSMLGVYWNERSRIVFKAPPAFLPRKNSPRQQRGLAFQGDGPFKYNERRLRVLFVRQRFFCSDSTTPVTPGLRTH